MGDIADYYRELDYGDCMDPHIDEVPEEEIDYQWTTKCGDIIFVKDMSSSHLQNTINMLKRGGNNKHAISIMEIEQKRRKQDD